MAEVEGCARIVRYLLFIFTFIFVITGIILLAMGVVLHTRDDAYATLLPSLGLSIANLLIIIGIIVFIVSFLGCCGAMRLSRWMLLTFFFALLLIFILELVVGFVGYNYKGQIEGFVTKDLIESLQQYNESEAYMTAWDNLQEQLMCCGVAMPDDWWKNTTFFANDQVPDSCCVEMKDNCGSTGADLWETGCKDALTVALEANIATVAGVGIAIALFEVLGMVFACCLLRSWSYTTVST